MAERDTVRADPYSGGSQLAVPFPTSSSAKPERPPRPVEADDSGDDEDQEFGEDQGDDGGGGSGGGPRSRGSSRRAPNLRFGSGDYGGVVLAMLLWGWIVLPYLGLYPGHATDGSGLKGVAGVKASLRAKFLNKVIGT